MSPHDCHHSSVSTCMSLCELADQQNISLQFIDEFSLENRYINSKLENVAITVVLPLKASRCMRNMFYLFNLSESHFVSTHRISCSCRHPPPTYVSKTKFALSSMKQFSAFFSGICPIGTLSGASSYLSSCKISAKNRTRCRVILTS